MRKFRVLKGRIAESLAEELLVMLGFDIHRVGQEHLLPPKALMSIRNRTGPRLTSIRVMQTMPDFWIESAARGVNAYVEVKFRADGRLNVDSLDDCPWLEEQNGILLLFAPNSDAGAAADDCIRAIRFADAVAQFRGRAPLDIRSLPTFRSSGLFGPLSTADHSDIRAIGSLAQSLFAGLPKETALRQNIASARNDAQN